MRTVVIATKEHIDHINEYEVFFKPFMQRDVVFCEWNKEGNSLEEIVPNLYNCIDGRIDWRVIVLCDESDKADLNPFDKISFTKEEVAEERPLGMFATIEEDLKKFQKSIEENIRRKKDAFDQASQMPLTKLATYFCPLPIDTTDTLLVLEDNCTEGNNAEEDLHDHYFESKDIADFNAYKETSNYKQKLRCQILNTGVLHAEYPQSVYCLALRKAQEQNTVDNERIKLAWKEQNAQYSSFCDSNMYFDQMRFFVYDILPKDHINYRFNYLKFIYTLLLFADNPIPNESVKPKQLYSLISDCSELKLKHLVTEYNSKLENTVLHINKKINEIENDIPKKISDDQADTVFISRDTIRVAFDKQFDSKNILTNSKVFGLYFDNPEREDSVWNRMHTTSKETIHKLLKQPRRALEKGAVNLRANNKNDSELYLALDKFQIADIESAVVAEEEKLVSIETDDFYDVNRYDQKLSEADNNVKKVISTRMKKAVAYAVGITILLAFFIGFIPILFFNESVLSIPIPLIITLVSIAILAVTGVVALFVLRSELIEQVEKYNNEARSVQYDVQTSMSKFSRYLSAACRVMQGNSVLNATKEKDNEYRQKVRIMHTHIENIRSKQDELYKLFGEYCIDHTIDEDVEPYHYIFDRVKKYDYNIPFNTGDDVLIPYVNDSNRIRVPFDFIDRISIRVEDLYE